MNTKKYLFLIILLIIPLTLYNNFSFGNEKSSPKLQVIEVKGKVIETDNSEIIASNISSIGYQSLKVKILNGDYKNKSLEISNSLYGQVENDQIFEKNDVLILALQIDNNGKIIQGKAIDYYRQKSLGFILLIFIAALLIYAKTIGFKALLSFGFSVFIIWKVLLVGLLEGKNPIFLTSITIILLSAIIIFLVSGFTKRGLAAFISTNFGLLTTLLITHFFGNELNLHGLTQPYVQSLIISGNYNLNLREIFYAAIILGASGAAMDISVDISASMHEIKEKYPKISINELIKSGFNIGRQVIGTMSTTLLLAYSGSYLTLLMLFITKNTSLTRMLNLKIVSAEIMRTLVGSIGLIIVAPVTACIAGILLSYSFNFSLFSLKQTSKSKNNL